MKALILSVCLLLAQQPASACPDLATIPNRLDYPSPYDQSDPSRSTVIPQRQQEMRTQLAPIDNAVRLLARQADRLDDPDAVDCLDRHLTHWAEWDALGDLQSDQAKMTIGARLAAFAILSRRLREAAPEREQGIISKWLLRRAKAQVNYWNEEAPENARKSNLKAWANLATWMIADLVDDRSLKTWTMNSHEEILCSVGPDGSLPAEMRRGQFSLHYQLHALTALVTLQSLAGYRTYPSCPKALKCAAEFALFDLEQGARTKALSGVTQSYFNGSETLDPHELAWIEAYLTLEDSPRAKAIAVKLRPLRNSKLGGNQTRLWRH